jgi:hypothetical protein
MGVHSFYPAMTADQVPAEVEAAVPRLEVEAAVPRLEVEDVLLVRPWQHLLDLRAQQQERQLFSRLQLQSLTLLRL